MVIQPQFYSAKKFKDGLALVGVNGKNMSQTEGYYDYFISDYGYIDKTGKFVIEPGKYDFAEDFSEGLASVSINNPNQRFRQGYIDTTGKVVIKGQFQTAGEFQNGTAAVRTGNDKWGMIDKTGKFIVQPIYDGLFPVIEEVGIGVKIKNEKSTPFDQKPSDFEFTFFDRTGKVIAKPSVFVFGSFEEGLVLYLDEIKKAMGFVDKTGSIAIEARFEKVLGFSNGLCPVRVNGKWGYIDKTGNFVIPPQYGEAFMFYDGLAKIQIDGKYGFIDKIGKIVIPPRGWDVSNFEDGLAYVRGNGLIDKTGKYVWKTID